MYINRNISWKLIFKFSFFRVLFFSLYGFCVVFFYHWLEHHEINGAIPFLPLSTIGIAVAFYIGFKNNQAYDRFWEARKIWGSIINYSRTWGNQVLSFMTLRLTEGKITEEELYAHQKRMIYRHIAWINALRLQLRNPSSFSINYKKHVSHLYKGKPGKSDWQESVGPFILKGEKEIQYLIKCKNTATQLIRIQGEELKEFMNVGIIEDFRHMELMGSLEEFYNLQGKCERIKKTPFPRQFAYFSGVFTWIFILLMPFGLVGEFAEMGHDFIWLTVPFFVLIAWIFITMEMVGDNTEDPFENFINDVPMTAICRTIEIDLRDMLGEEDLPENIQAVDGVLM